MMTTAEQVVRSRRAAASVEVAVAIVTAMGLAAPALPQGGGIGSSASITVVAPGGKDRYDFAPREACLIAAFGKRPLGLSVVLTSEQASLSIDMPSIDEKHAGEIQVVLVVAETKSGTVGTSSIITYEIDTRPDAALEPFQKAERARKGLSGKASTTLMQQGASVLLAFSGETSTAVKLSGEVTCHKVADGT